jgi:transposase-like protein
MNNAIESLSMSLCRVLETRGGFPSEEAALKVMYLALKNLTAKWQVEHGWRDALNCFSAQWEDRFPLRRG